MGICFFTKGRSLDTNAFALPNSLSVLIYLRLLYNYKYFSSTERCSIVFDVRAGYRNDIPELHGKHGTGCFSALRKELGDLIF